MDSRRHDTGKEQDSDSTDLRAVGEEVLEGVGSIPDDVDSKPSKKWFAVRLRKKKARSLEVQDMLVSDTDAPMAESDALGTTELDQFEDAEQLQGAHVQPQGTTFGTYSKPTQASMAKQTEKVELPQARRRITLNPRTRQGDADLGFNHGPSLDVASAQPKRPSLRRHRSEHKINNLPRRPSSSPRSSFGVTSRVAQSSSIEGAKFSIFSENKLPSSSPVAYEELEKSTEKRTTPAPIFMDTFNFSPRTTPKAPEMSIAPDVVSFDNGEYGYREDASLYDDSGHDSVNQSRFSSSQLHSADASPFSVESRDIVEVAKENPKITYLSANKDGIIKVEEINAEEEKSSSSLPQINRKETLEEYIAWQTYIQNQGQHEDSLGYGSIGGRTEISTDHGVGFDKLDEQQRGSPYPRDMVESLHRQIASLETRLQTAYEDLALKARVEKEVDLRNTDPALDRLRKHTQEISNALELMIQRQPTKTELNAFKGMATKHSLGSEVNVLHSCVFQLVVQYEDRLESLTEDVEYHRSLLEDSEDKTVALKRPVASQEQSSAERNSLHTPKGEGNWKAMYYKERHIRKGVEQQCEKLEEMAKKWHQSDFEKRIRDLKMDLTNERDATKAFKEEAKKLSGKARHWEDMYKTAREEAERATAGLELEVENQKMEMLRYVKEYHDKTKEGEHWRLRGLQQAIHTLEQESLARNELLNWTKRDMQALEFQYLKLDEINRQDQREIKYLQKACMRGRVDLTLPQTKTSFDTSSNSSSSSSAAEFDHEDDTPNDQPAIPHYRLSSSIRQRHTAMVRLRKEQAERRKAEKDEQDELERMRKDVLGEWYPPATITWGQFLQKSSLERWNSRELL